MLQLRLITNVLCKVVGNLLTWLNKRLIDTLAPFINDRYSSQLTPASNRLALN